MHYSTAQSQVKQLGLTISLQHAFFAHVIFLTQHVDSPTLTHNKTTMSSIELFDNQSDDSLCAVPTIQLVTSVYRCHLNESN